VHEEASWLPGVHPAGNIQDDPDVYEVENRAADPDQLIEQAMRSIHDWRDALVVDLGCGTGFHLPRFSPAARHVFGIEPHGPSRLRAMRRCVDLGLTNVSILTGSAERIPIADATIDVVHARFAYFFGPGSEDGVREVMRILRPGGAAFIIDNDRRHGTFSTWLARSSWAPPVSADEVESFWAGQGFQCLRIVSAWRFECRADLEAVVRIEFPPALAEQVIAEHTRTTVDCHYRLYHRLR
jgi:SAM-dependent methyltransferase